MIAGLTRLVRDVGLAEELAQDALVTALEKWPEAGVPVIRVTHRLRDNELRGYAFMRARLEEWLRAAGAARVWSTEQPILETRHCYGGTRMSDDPATSVVDRRGFAHEVPILGILGASTFATTGGLNPTLTVQALAWRTAAHVVADWGAIAPDGPR